MAERPDDQLKAQHDVRTTLLQGLAAVLVLTGGGAGRVMAALDGSDPALRAQLYQELAIQGTYDPHSRIVVVCSRMVS